MLLQQVEKQGKYFETNKLYRYLRTWSKAIGHIDVIVLMDKESPKAVMCFHHSTGLYLDDG